MLKKLSRRDFLKGVSFVAAGSVLAACAPQAAPTSAPAAAQPTQAPAASTGGKSLVYWFQWGTDYEKGVNDMKKLPEWKEYMGDYDVTTKSGVGEDALLTSIAGGTPPDLAANYNYLDYMARGVLRPVDDYVAASKRIKKEDYFDGNWALGTYKGKLYGIPAVECFLRYGINYNKQMVSDAGLDPTNPPETWDEWLVWHKALTKFDSAGNLKQIGLDPTDAMGSGLWSTDGWLYQLSEDVTWFDVNTGKFNLNNPQMIDYLNTTKQFTDIIGMDNLAGMRKVQAYGTWGGSFNAWVQAVIIEGYWHPGETVNQQPTHTPPNMATWVPVPTSRKGAKCQLAGGHMIMIFSASKYPEAGYAFTELNSTKAACDLIFKEVGWLPAVKSYIAQVDPSPYPGLDFYIKSATEATNWYGALQCPITSFVDTKFEAEREQVNRGQLTAEAMAAQLQKECEAEYKNAGFSS
jgi:multiple sugar transport system substrate-binding protein